MSPKFIFFLITSYILVFSVTEAAKVKKLGSNDITFGAKSDREVHLGRFTVKEKFKRLKTIEKEFVYRVKPEDVNYRRTITRIVVTDQYKNGKGGSATLKDGGPSTNYAVIKLKSKRNHGYHFVIDIYGI